MADVTTRHLGMTGAVGGLLWAAFPVWFLLSLYGDGVGAILTPVGGLLLYGLFVPLGLMAGGVVGLHRLHRDRFDRVGRAGTGISLIGFALFVPTFLIPPGSSLSGLVSASVMSGIAGIAVGAALLGYAARRAAMLPRWAPTFLAVAMPGGAAVGAVLAIAGAGNAPLAAGLLLPYGLAWIVVGTQVWRYDG